MPAIPVEELQELAEHINQMAERLETLIAETRRNQEHLAKAELRTLQAQINPHFLYNTLDAIVWQAESGKGDEVVRLTRNLSDFFRIALSSGADWIPVTQELKHVSAYLSIQQTRYRDILTYEVDSPEGMENVYMLKLLLQPLVENALYHGIKEKRGGGRITVRMQAEGALMHFTVTDTGKGMAPEQLKEIRRALDAEKPSLQAALEPGYSGFGLRNVDMRIRLYYGKKKGLTLKSGPEGTEVSFVIPIRSGRRTAWKCRRKSLTRWFPVPWWKWNSRARTAPCGSSCPGRLPAGCAWARVPRRSTTARRLPRSPMR